MINIAVLKSQMSSLGYSDHCEFCYNGESAVRKANEVISSGQTLGLMILDFQMPKMNGIEVVVAIKDLCRNKKQKEPKFVFMTAYATTVMKNRC